MPTSWTCPVCLGPDPHTDEDLMPNWLRSAVIEAAPPTGQATPRYKVRICGTCNSRLGQVFESTTADVLRPVVSWRNTELSVDDQVLMARWIVKTYLLSTVAHNKVPDRVSEILRRLLLTLIDSPGIPFAVSVRTASIWTDRDATERLRPGSFFPASEGWPAVRGVTHMGSLLWEVVVFARPTDVAGFVAGTPDDDHVVRVWPPRDAPLTWPPVSLQYPDMRAWEQEWDLDPAFVKERGHTTSLTFTPVDAPPGYEAVTWAPGPGSTGV